MGEDPVLWGVSKTAPYFHDGRAETIAAAILLHAGEAEAAREAYEDLTTVERLSLLAFLEDL